MQCIDEEVETIKQRIKNLTVADVAGDRALFGAMQSLMRVGMQQQRLRHKYFGIAPWSFVNADTPEGAQVFLADVQSKPVDRQDELSCHLESEYRADLEDLRDNGVLSQKLSDGIREYEQTPLDEGAGEGYHRATHLTKLRAAASSDPFVKQSTRLKQNIDMLKQFIRLRNGRRILRFEWRKWSRVLQTKKRSYYKAKKMTSKQAIRRIYRMDEKAKEDWGSICAKVLAPGQGDLTHAPKEVPKEKSRQQRCEYLHCALKPMRWYCVDIPQADIDDNWRPVERQERQYFQVLRVVTPQSRPKLMPTIKSQEDIILTSRLAFHVQRASVSRDRASTLSADAEDNNVQVFFDEDDDWADWQDLGPFEHVYTSLMVFQSAEGVEDQQNCLSLGDPVSAAPTLALSDAKCPTLMIYNALLDQGWKSVEQTVHHSAASRAKVMDIREAAKMKCYYQVLLDLPRYVPSAHPQGIPSDQPISFFKLLLKGRSVQPHLGDKVYLQMLKNPDSNVLPLAAPSEEGNGSESEASEDFVLDVGVGEAPAPSALQDEEEPMEGAPRRRPKAKAKAKTKFLPKTTAKGPASEHTAAPPAGLPTPPATPPAVLPTTLANAPLSTPPAPPTPPFGEETFIVDALVLAPLVLADARVLANTGRLKRKREKAQWKTAIGGGHVRYQDYKHPDGGIYGNFRFRCPYHHNCAKTAGTGASNIADLGPLQPSAFLHAWRDVLVDADEDIDPRSHNGTPPTIEEVKAFHDAHIPALATLAAECGYEC